MDKLESCFKDKKCPKCEQTLSADYFYQQKNGLSAYCKNCRREYKKEQRANKTGYYATELQKNKESRVVRRKENPEKYRELDKNVRNKLRLKVLTEYCEGTPSCTKCGFTDIRALSLDHINGDGAEHRRSGIFGHKLYNWAVRNNYPDKLQVLCMNCQFIKRDEENECAR